MRYASFVLSTRQLLIRILPAPVLDAYRRRRALRGYLRSLSYEIYDRNRVHQLEDLEGELLARRPDFTNRLMDDLLKRTDILVRQLDRQIEGMRARHGSLLSEIRQDVDALLASVESLRAEMREGPRVDTPAGNPAVD